jgi:hypothetical protein
VANNVFRGDAKNVYQETDYVFGGTWETTDIVNVVINNKTLAVVAGSATTATVVSTVVTAFNAVDTDLYPEFADITASADTTTLTLTSDVAGVPFTCTISTTETGGGAADAQTIDGGTSSTGTTSTANSGSNNWDTASNWTAATAPADTEDVYIENSSVGIYYGLSNANTELTSLNIGANYTGHIGLPVFNTAGYREYRDTFLRVDSTTVNIGYGEGQGSQRLKLDLGTSDAFTVNVLRTANPIEDGVPSLLLKGGLAGCTLNVRQGSVGVAFFPGETAVIPTIRIGSQENPASDVDLILGTGCTLTTITQSGGTLTVNSNVTTLTVYSGEVNVLAGAITTLTLETGRAYITSTGTITTLTIGTGATADFSRDPRARTITNCSIAPGGTLLDPYKSITFTNPFSLTRCGLDAVRLDLGESISIQRS